MLDSKEREELRELRDRLIKLETMIELEFKHLREDLQSACESIRKLNEEYGRLLQRQVDLEIKNSNLETKFNKSVGNWKLATFVISPIITTVIVIAIHYLLGVY